MDPLRPLANNAIPKTLPCQHSRKFSWFTNTLLSSSMPRRLSTRFIDNHIMPLNRHDVTNECALIMFNPFRLVELAIVASNRSDTMQLRFIQAIILSTEVKTRQ
mmetsp:Transcript_33892/g.49086  ORF Transcript_33892/g.49086 Transcript_33892/m.49086 type:complete len:104 (-) Transcript_33892:491-802(-)